MGPSYNDYWGKAPGNEGGDPVYHLLPYHCLDVAAVGTVLLQKDPSLSRRLVHIAGGGAHQFFRSLLFFLASHDIGKFAEGFQNLRPDLFLLLRGKQSMKGYSVRHDSLGYALWHDRLWDCAWQQGWLGVTGADREKILWERLFDPVARSVTGHHGVPPSKTGANKLKISASMHFRPAEMSAAEEFARDASAILVDSLEMLPGSSSEHTRSSSDQLSWLLAGMTVLCDWVASGHFNLVSNPIPLTDYWRNHALPQAEEVLARTGVIPVEPSVSMPASSLFPAIEIFSPLQRHAADCSIHDGPQLFILEDVTGSGKTEAAVILAHRLLKEGHGTGLFIALPTMATSNSMYERLAKSYHRLFEEDAHPSLLLTHSARHLSKAFRRSVIQPERKEAEAHEQYEESAEVYCAAWLADNRKKALLADVGVGTLDQALLAALPVKYQSLRLFGLARHVLIADEVHAYDPYMHVLLQNLLRFQAALGGSAILLSATLPMRTRLDLAGSFAQGLGSESVHLENTAYPLITQVTGNGSVEIAALTGENRRISQEVRLISDTREVEERIVCASERGQCVCWIRNTVHDALGAHEMLQNRIPSQLLLLFHARFAMGDRLAREEQVCAAFGKTSTYDARKGKVLVATQVVEQSLGVFPTGVGMNRPPLNRDNIRASKKVQNHPYLLSGFRCL